MDRIKTAVLFGGQSSEHIVSCMSAVNVIRQIDREKYDLLLIGITEDGRWLRTDCVEDIESGAWREGTARAVILPDAQKGCALIQDGERQWEEKIDVVFPVLHGLYGKTERSRGFWRWRGSPTWDAGFCHPRFLWINCIQRSLQRIWASARRPMSRCTGKSLRRFRPWWNGLRSGLPIRCS